MASGWQRHGIVVLVTLNCGDDDALWETLRSRMYGVSSIEDDARTRTRVLSLPEAYYALAEDHLLAVPTTPNFPSLRAVWDEFSSASTSFVSQYIVYHHFRRLGWLLRSGLNYGAPFVLYRGDPNTFHSEYIVSIASDTATSSHWHALQGRTRVAEDVKKTVVLCEVSVADSSAEQDPAIQRRDTEDPVMATYGQYKLHGVLYAMDAVLIRYWDTATVDDVRVSYAFTPQPLLLKNPKKTPKKKAKEKKRPRVD